MRRLKIVITDDHEVVRRGIRSLLEARTDWEVCAEASTGEEALQCVKKFKPEVLVLDISLPDRNAIDVARQVRTEFPSTEVLILTVQETPAVVGEALAADVRGLVSKSDAGKDLVNAVEAVSQKTAFVSARVTEMIVKSGVPHVAEKPLDALTGREREVLRMLAQGKNVKEIGADLNISPKTVNVHRANMMEKLQIHSLSDLIHFAIRNKIVEL